MHRADRLIHDLHLQPHPEGGWFRETHRSRQQVATPHGERAAATAIWFLLRSPQVSRWHRIRSDECWHWYEGLPLQLLMCERPGQPIVRQRLGPAADGALPQRIVPAGWWQAALLPPEAYALVGCTVAPGFDFADFTILDPAGADAAWFRKQADARLVDGTP